MSNEHIARCSCGGNGKAMHKRIKLYKSPQWEWFVQCRKCGGRPRFVGRNRQEAITLWNESDYLIAVRGEVDSV